MSEVARAVALVCRSWPTLTQGHSFVCEFYHVSYKLPSGCSTSTGIEGDLWVCSSSHSMFWVLENAWDCLQPRPPPPSLPSSFPPSHPFTWNSYFYISSKGQQQLWIWCASVSEDSGKLPESEAAAHWKTLQKALASILSRGNDRGRGRGKGGRGKEGLERLRENWRSLVVCASWTTARSSQPIQDCIPQVRIQIRKTVKDTTFPRERGVT